NPSGADHAHPDPDKPAHHDPDSAEATREERNKSLPHPEAAAQEHASLPPDDVQQAVRQDPNHPVHRIELDPVHDRMRGWAEDGSLGRLLESAAERKLASDEARKAAEDDPGHHAEMPPTAFTERELRQVLGDDFARMNDGERGVVVATLARMSLAFHEDNGVGRSPEPAPDGDSPYKGAPPRKKDDLPDPIAELDISAGADSRESAKAGWPADHREPGSDTHDALKELREKSTGKHSDRDVSPADVNKLLKSAGVNKPDFSGKNYAVLEVVNSHGESTYVVDSSIPAGGEGYTPRHSEKHLLEWVERLNKSKEAAGQQPYSIAGLYTEREPCGEGAGHARCSTEISKRTSHFPVFYSTTYRTDPEGQPSRDAVRAELRKEQEELLATVKDLPEKAQKDRLRKAGLTDGLIDKRVKANRVPNEQIMDQEMHDHLSAMGEIWAKTRLQMLS
ncbi:hypothetical protein EYS09_36225, partial [Streptomyces kasugaensis]